MEKENKEKQFKWDLCRSFEERCKILRATTINRNMSYKERLAAQKRRYGLI